MRIQWFRHIRISSISTRSLTLKGSLQFQAVMDELEAHAAGTMNSNQGPVINGVLPGTSAAS